MLKLICANVSNLPILIRLRAELYYLFSDARNSIIGIFKARLNSEKNSREKIVYESAQVGETENKLLLPVKKVVEN